MLDGAGACVPAVRPGSTTHTLRPPCCLHRGSWKEAGWGLGGLPGKAVGTASAPRAPCRRRLRLGLAWAGCTSPPLPSPSAPSLAHAWPRALPTARATSCPEGAASLPEREGAPRRPLLPGDTLGHGPRPALPTAPHEAAWVACGTWAAPATRSWSHRGEEGCFPPVGRQDLVLSVVSRVGPDASESRVRSTPQPAEDKASPPEVTKGGLPENSRQRNNLNNKKKQK